jgi:hypothetical protein
MKKIILIFTLIVFSISNFSVYTYAIEYKQNQINNSSSECVSFASNLINGTLTDEIFDVINKDVIELYSNQGYEGIRLSREIDKFYKSLQNSIQGLNITISNEEDYIDTQKTISVKYKNKEYEITCTIKNSREGIFCLPKEMLIRILELLDFASMLRFRLVNIRFNNLAANDEKQIRKKACESFVDKFKQNTIYPMFERIYKFYEKQPKSDWEKCYKDLQTDYISCSKEEFDKYILVIINNNKEIFLNTQINQGLIINNEVNVNVFINMLVNNFDVLINKSNSNKFEIFEILGACLLISDFLTLDWNNRLIVLNKMIVDFEHNNLNKNILDIQMVRIITKFVQTLNVNDRAKLFSGDLTELLMFDDTDEVFKRANSQQRKKIINDVSVKAIAPDTSDLAYNNIKALYRYYKLAQTQDEKKLISENIIKILNVFKESYKYYNYRDEVYCYSFQCCVKQILNCIDLIIQEQDLDANSMLKVINGLLDLYQITKTKQVISKYQQIIENFVKSTEIKNIPFVLEIISKMESFYSYQDIYTKIKLDLYTYIFNKFELDELLKYCVNDKQKINILSSMVELMRLSDNKTMNMKFLDILLNHLEHNSYLNADCKKDLKKFYSKVFNMFFYQWNDDDFNKKIFHWFFDNIDKRKFVVEQFRLGVNELCIQKDYRDFNQGHKIYNILLPIFNSSNDLELKLQILYLFIKTRCKFVYHTGSTYSFDDNFLDESIMKLLIELYRNASITDKEKIVEMIIYYLQYNRSECKNLQLIIMLFQECFDSASIKQQLKILDSVFATFITKDYKDDFDEGEYKPLMREVAKNLYKIWNEKFLNQKGDLYSVDIEFKILMIILKVNTIKNKDVINRLSEIVLHDGERIINNKMWNKAFDLMFDSMMKIVIDGNNKKAKLRVVDMIFSNRAFLKGSYHQRHFTSQYQGLGHIAEGFIYCIREVDDVDIVNILFDYYAQIFNSLEPDYKSDTINSLLRIISYNSTNTFKRAKAINFIFENFFILSSYTIINDLLPYCSKEVLDDLMTRLMETIKKSQNNSDELKIECIAILIHIFNYKSSFPKEKMESVVNLLFDCLKSNVISDNIKEYILNQIYHLTSSTLNPISTNACKMLITKLIDNYLIFNPAIKNKALQCLGEIFAKGSDKFTVKLHMIIEFIRFYNIVRLTTQTGDIQMNLFIQNKLNPIMDEYMKNVSNINHEFNSLKQVLILCFHNEELFALIYDFYRCNNRDEIFEKASILLNRIKSMIFGIKLNFLDVLFLNINHLFKNMCNGYCYLADFNNLNKADKIWEKAESLALLIQSRVQGLIVRSIDLMKRFTRIRLSIKCSRMIVGTETEKNEFYDNDSIFKYFENELKCEKKEMNTPDEEEIVVYSDGVAAYKMIFKNLDGTINVKETLIAKIDNRISFNTYRKLSRAIIECLRKCGMIEKMKPLVKVLNLRDIVLNVILKINPSGDLSPETIEKICMAV